jgi:hypothetical protein
MTEHENHNLPIVPQRDVGTGSRLPTSGKFANSSRPVLSPVARYGLVGEVVDLLEPHTEADPAALVLEFLVGYGHAVGHEPYLLMDGSRHTPRLFGLLVGPTARGRKGTAHDNVRPLFYFYQEASGLSTGEGLIQATSNLSTYQRQLVFVEPEFGRTLSASQRRGATLSFVLREFWDTEHASVLTRKDPLHVEGVHLSFIGHITAEELSSGMKDVDVHNGFLNRYLFVYSHREKIDPFLGRIDPDAEGEIKDRIHDRLRAARAGSGFGREVTWSPPAKDTYRDIYDGLHPETGNPKFDGLTARAEAQIARLSLCYALTDGVHEIARDHVEAAAAFWKYSEDTVRWFLSESDGFASQDLDRIEDVILKAGIEGMTLTELHTAFSRHLKEAREKVQQLFDEGRVIVVKEKTDGAEKWTIYHPTNLSE